MDLFKPLNLDAIYGYLLESPNFTIQLLDEVDSTNTYLKNLALRGAPDGTAVLAEHQTGGRGRMGRTFQCHRGKGLYLSVLLRPDCHPNQLMNLTCLAAVDASDAIQLVTGRRPSIKWVNDLQFDDRKVAGILTEMTLDPETGRVRTCVLGIGINCLQAPWEFPEDLRDTAGSLLQFTKRDIDRDLLAAILIGRFRRLTRMSNEDIDGAMDQYRRCCSTIGTCGTIRQPGKPDRFGLFMDVADNGGLLVDCGQGLELLQSGEASVVRGSTMDR